MHRSIPFVFAVLLLAPLSAVALPLDLFPSDFDGNRKIVVIPFEFVDVKGVHSPLMIQNMFFAQGGDERSVRDYFIEVSGGQMVLGGVVLQKWYTSSRTMMEYGHGDGFGRESPNVSPLLPTHSICEMAREAVALVEADGFDFSPYVDPVLGTVPIVIIHAGTPNDGSGIPMDIWSQAWGGCIGQWYDGVYVDGFMTDSEFSPVGTNAHELGHLLLRLPDLYFGSNPVKRYDLMASGSWGGDPTDEPRDLQVDWTQGQDPAHLGPYFKSILGWTQIQTVPADGIARTYSLPPAESASGVRALRLDVQTNACWAEVIDAEFNYRYERGSRYFLVEYRTYNAGRYDGGIGGDGIVTWYIDECAVGDSNWWWWMNQEDRSPRIRAIQDALPPMEVGDAFSPIGLWSSTIAQSRTGWFVEVVSLGADATVRVGKTMGDVRIFNPSAPSTVSAGATGSREVAFEVRADGMAIGASSPSVWARDARLQMRLEPGAMWSVTFAGENAIEPHCDHNWFSGVANCVLPAGTPPGEYVIQVRSWGNQFAQRVWDYPVTVV